MILDSAIDSLVQVFVKELLTAIFSFLEALFASLAEGFHITID